MHHFVAEKLGTGLSAKLAKIEGYCLFSEIISFTGCDLLAELLLTPGVLIYEVYEVIKRKT